MIYLFLADGFEETEAIVPLDILKRVEVGVTTVGIGGRAVVGAHGIAVGADFADSEMPIPDDIDGVILPAYRRNLRGAVYFRTHGLASRQKSHLFRRV